MKKLVILLFTIFTAILIVSCSEEMIEPTDAELEQTRLSDEVLNCLREGICEKSASGIEMRNLQKGKLINFDLLWANYPGKKYLDQNNDCPYWNPNCEFSMEEVKEMVGGNVDADWIQNTCTIRLSRAMNYSNNDVSKTEFRKYAGQWGNQGLVITGDDGKWYAPRVAEMALYLKKFYDATPLTFRKSAEVREMLTDRSNLYDSANVAETERIENEVRALGKKGIMMFNVALWSDATGHFEVWNGEIAKGHARFMEAQEVFLWVVEESTDEEPGTPGTVSTDSNGNYTYESASHRSWKRAGTFSYLSCRSGAGTNNGVITYLGKDEEIESLNNVDYDSSNNPWFEMRTDNGYECFVRAKDVYIEPVISDEPVISTDSDGNYTDESASHRSWKRAGTFSYLSCRSGAGTNNGVITYLGKDEEIESLNNVDYDSSNNPWFEIRTDDGNECFVRARDRYINPVL